MAKIFNRKDPQVAIDASKMTEVAFCEKYSDTGANTGILSSVFRSFTNAKLREQKIAATTDEATTLVEAHAEVIVDEEEAVAEVITTKIKKEGKKDRVIVEVDDLKDTPEKKGKKSKGDDKGGEVKNDKPGRTPRMRELIKEIGVDKVKVKAALDAEGFNTSGSGFHSEWNRVSKA